MGDPKQLQQLQQQVEALSALQQPTAVLPVVCSAVFGAAPDHQTLSGLYDLARQYIGTGCSSSNGNSSDSNSVMRAVTAAAAAWTILLASQTSTAVVRQFVQEVFLPLAIFLQGTPHAALQVQQLAELIAKKQAWQVALEVLQSAHAALQAALPDEPDVAVSTHQDGTQVVQVKLPPATACAVMRHLVSAANQAAQSDNSADLQSVLQLSAGPLLTTTQQLLWSSDSTLRQAAFQQLLAELLQAAVAVGPAQHTACMQRLFEQCLDMVARPVIPRRMGLAVLLQYWPEWQLQPPSPGPEAQPGKHKQSPSAAASSAEAIGTQSPQHAGSLSRIAADSSQRFWRVLQECLVDPEPLNRKRALRLLQLLLPKAQLQSEPVWGVLLALYELLDEFTPHLVKATWPMVSQLHQPAAAYAAEDATADIASSKKLDVLSKGKQVLTAATGQQVQPQQPMAFCWSNVIWTRALQHKNLQVQRMAMKTLLKRDWSPDMLCQVPVSFLTDTLLPALLSPVHHNTTLAATLAASGAVLDPHKQQDGGSSSSGSFSVTAQAGQLLSSWAVCAEPAALRQLFKAGLELVASPTQELSKSGLYALLQVLTVAAEQLVRQGHRVLGGLPQTEAESYAELGLQQLQLVLSRLLTYHGTEYKASCCCLLVSIAAAVAPPGGSCRLKACVRLAQAMPLWMLAPGGPVNPGLKAWLTGSTSSSSSSSVGDGWLAKESTSLWDDYFSTGVQDTQQHHIATATQYAAWRAASDAWLRVMMCCGDELQEQLAAAVTDLATRAEQVISRSYLPMGLPDRVLIMAQQLCDMGEAARRVSVQQDQQQDSAEQQQQQDSAEKQQQQLPALTRAALQFAAGAGGSALGQLLPLQCSCYHSSQQMLAGSALEIPRAKSGAAAAGQMALTPAAWQAAARAEETAHAAAAAAVLMAKCIAPAEAAGSTIGAPHVGDKVAGMSAELVLRFLLRLLQQLAGVGEALAAKPLPVVTADKAQGPASEGPLAAVAAAAELSRASAISVLRHVCQGMSRALACLPQQQLPSDLRALQPATWIDALLRETAAASAAASHWEPVLASSGPVGDVTAGWIKGVDWACLDAALALTALLGTPPSAPAANGGAARPAQACRGTERLPAGVLWEDVLVSLLPEAISALQWASAGAMLHLLRCLRRVWALLLDDRGLQAAALSALAASGHIMDAPCDTDDGPDTNLLLPLSAALGHSMLGVLHGTRKRPLLLCGSLVHTLLLPELMLFDPEQQPLLVALHAGPDAPLRRFVSGLLQHGAKGSPVLYLVVALRLGACIPDAPQLLGWYHEELKQLLLFAAPLEASLHTKSSLAHEAATEWSLLTETLEPQLATAGVITGMGPRIAVVAALQQLAAAAGLTQMGLQQHAPKHQQQQQALSSAPCRAAAGYADRAAAAGVGLWHRWMQAALHDPILSSASCLLPVGNTKQGSDTHRSKVRLWQGLTAAVPFLCSPTQQEAATQAVKDIMTCLLAVNPPSVKQYQEASATYLLLKHTHLIQQLLLPELLDLEKGGPATASHILMAVQSALHAGQQEQLMPQVLLLLLPWTNHHTHNIRVFAQLGVCALLEAKPLDSWTGWQAGLGAGGVEMVRSLQRFYYGNADFQRFRRSMGAGMLAWSPEDVATPAGIFCRSLSLAGSEDMSSASVTFEGCPQSLMDTVVHFLAEERAKLRETAADAAAAAAAAVAAGSGSQPATASSAANGCGASAGGVQLDFQRKVAPSERALLLADVLDDALEAAQGVGGPSAPAGTRRHDLVVVASLIDKVPNLAGLARTAEVLGAGTLVLGDLRVAADQLFTSISVTAERWVPLLEVKEAALLGWLQQQKALGYTLVGLEQTAESTQLPSYTFPTKTVLVLGREKEGVPPEIIALLDATVEIPQLGVIRSLNVHVSGAIAMYEYTKQQLQASCRSA